MKILDTPRTGKLGLAVAFQSRFGLCLRQWVCPKKTITEARERVWGFMGYFARAWSGKLTQAQRERWIVAAGNVLSASRLTCGPLTGQQFFEMVNLSRACIGVQPPLWEPPAREIFGLNPVGQLSVVNGPQGPRLLLSVTGSVTEDVMVFGQAPCSAGRSKRRNVAYLGLLPPPENGLSDITDIYVAKYGPLKPGTKVFIVTRQQKNGWEGPLKETSEIVPIEVAEDQELHELHALQGLHGANEVGLSAGNLAKPVGQEQQAPTEPVFPSKPLMYTGCTGDAQGDAQTAVPRSQEGSEAGAALAEAAKAALGGSETAGGVGGVPG